MDNFKIGDLVQHIGGRSAFHYRKLWYNKIGIVSAIRNNTNIAYIKWSDPDANDTWIAYEDLVLLNRE